MKYIDSRKKQTSSLCYHYVNMPYVCFAD